MTQTIFILFSVSFFFSVGLLYFLIRSPLASYFQDPPDTRKVHQNIVPRIGGLGVIFCFGVLGTASLFFLDTFTGFSLSNVAIFSIISILILTVGTLDDIFQLNYKVKFGFQFLLAAILVFGFDIRFETIHLFDYSFSIGLAGSFLSVIWIVGVMNAFNIIDGVDGLASIVSIIAFTTLAILFNASGAFAFVLICVILSGTTSGFLIHNMSDESKSFLGDTGSLFFGAMLAVLSIIATNLPTTHLPIFAPLLIVGYPIFDISVAMVRRFKRKQSKINRSFKNSLVKMFQADNEHLHHRLVHFGMSHIQTTLLLSMVAASMGSVAIIISRNSTGIQIISLCYLMITLTLILNRLSYLGKTNWLTAPRRQAKPKHKVGVIQSDDLFYTSLRHFQQYKFSYHNIDWPHSVKEKKDFSAIIVHNDLLRDFKETWKQALRLSEVQECPVFLIATRQQFRLVQAPPQGFKNIVPVYKPARIPELIALMAKRLNNKEMYHQVEYQATDTELPPTDLELKREPI